MVRTNTGQSLNFIIFPFSIWSPCSWTKSGQYWDTSPKFVPFLSRHLFILYLPLLYGFYGRIDAGQKLDNCPRFVLIFSNLMPWSWPTCCQTGHKLDNLTCFCPNCVFSIPTLKLGQMLDKIWTFVLYHSNHLCAASPIFPTMFQSPMFH